MSISGKSAAKAFRKKFKLLSPSLDDIKSIISSQGYTIIEFNAILNNDEVTLIIESLNLDDYVLERKGFTYADSKTRLVFVNEDLSVDEKLNILLHEEGHIFCGHIEENTYLGRDVQQEVEANDFAYCMQNPTVKEKTIYFLRKNKIWMSIVALTFAIGLICFSFYMGNKGNKQENHDEYFVTATGNKYHQSDCIHIKNKTNTCKISAEELKSGKYEPCGICLPQG